MTNGDDLGLGGFLPGSARYDDAAGGPFLGARVAEYDAVVQGADI